jgi:hypothetical protein
MDFFKKKKFDAGDEGGLNLADESKYRDIDDLEHEYKLKQLKAKQKILSERLKKQEELRSAKEMVKRLRKAEMAAKVKPLKSLVRVRKKMVTGTSKFVPGKKSVHRVGRIGFSGFDSRRGMFDFSLGKGKTFFTGGSKRGVLSLSALGSSSGGGKRGGMSLSVLGSSSGGGKRGGMSLSVLGSPSRVSSSRVKRKIRKSSSRVKRKIRKARSKK